ncbi:hypothetical protein V1478_003035 [Vespula squamosa]|uniref:Uncharacterized protein n=1 Tax=Vespula squamosa TaxID=30214 RepID=A0ABD2BRI7_VESSQ
MLLTIKSLPSTKRVLCTGASGFHFCYIQTEEVYFEVLMCTRRVNDVPGNVTKPVRYKPFNNDIHVLTFGYCKRKNEKSTDRISYPMRHEIAKVRHGKGEGPKGTREHGW